MNRIVRTIHLYSGLVLVAFITMYVVTGVVMTHGQFFPKRATTEKKTERPLQYPGAWSAQDLTRWAKEQFDVHGRAVQATTKPDGSWDLRYSNAGSDTSVKIPGTHDKATIRVKTRNFIDMLHGLHRIHGYRGGWFYILWAVAIDLVGLAMIAFAITGIWMWYTMTKRRWFGWVLLAGSFGYAAAMIAYLL